MSWNHRVLIHEELNYEHFMIHEVYYDKNGKPDSYTENGVRVGGHDLKSIKWSLNKMKECLKKPILYYGDKFPQEYVRKE
jgi:hypothetical protein